MNATRLHFDSSDSEEDLKSKRKKREMLEGKEIAEISWVPTNTQIAHSLTKKGVPSSKILGFMSEPKESSV